MYKYRAGQKVKIISEFHKGITFVIEDENSRDMSEKQSQPKYYCRKLGQWFLEWELALEQ